MEKLTIQLSNGANRCALVSTDLCLQNKDCFSCPQYRKMVDRLAAYEEHPSCRWRRYSGRSRLARGSV